MRKGKEQNKREQKLTFWETIKNDCYALRLGFSIGKSMVIHSFFVQASGYFEWVFFDAVFIRYIVGALDQNQDFRLVFQFILMCGALFFFAERVRELCGERSISPVSDQTVLRSLYKIV